MLIEIIAVSSIPAVLSEIIATTFCIIPQKIEIEPFSNPSVALQNTRILEKIRKKDIRPQK